MPKKATAPAVEGKRFVKRVRKPKKQGKEKKSQMVRVYGPFADWLRARAEKEGSVVEVTRKLHAHIIEVAL